MGLIHYSIWSAVKRVKLRQNKCNVTAYAWQSVDIISNLLVLYY